MQDYQHIENTIEFFDLKRSFREQVEEFEKSVYVSNNLLNKLLDTFNKLEKVGNKLDPQNYSVKLAKLKEILFEVQAQKKYNKFDFDKIFNKLDSLKQPEVFGQLDELTDHKSNDIVEHIEDTLDPKDRSLYLAFNFNGVNFIVKNLPRKIVHNVDVHKKTVLVKGTKHEIFPKYNLGEDSQNYIRNPKCNLLILEVQDNIYKCFHFDYLDNLVFFTQENFEKKLIPLSNPIGEITKYLNWKDRRYYWLEV